MGIILSSTKMNFINQMSVKIFCCFFKGFVFIEGFILKKEAENHNKLSRVLRKPWIMGIFCMRPKRPQVRCIICSTFMVEKCNFLIGFNPNSILSLASNNNLHAEILISCLDVQFLACFSSSNSSSRVRLTFGLRFY